MPLYQRNDVANAYQISFLKPLALARTEADKFVMLVDCKNLNLDKLPQLLHRIYDKQDIRIELDDALKDEEIKVYYQPIYDAWQAVAQKIGRKPRTVYLTPQGNTFQQEMAKDYAKEEDLVLLCGHYEGIDERVLEEIVTDYVSIGDYVLTGGELPAMVMVDAISRMVPGVLANDESGTTESFEGNLLEYPQYSRPEDWMGKKVPAILLSGDHAKVEAWRREQSIKRTMERRPDLLADADLTTKEKAMVEHLLDKSQGKC